MGRQGIDDPILDGDPRGRSVPLANAEFLDERLPASRLVIVDRGHFIWEESPTEYASIILSSITGGRS
jgi:pimeloyl-ACP methyl ester carboxylesterase